jgi:predicted NBD/HSP70 family sugar kinase
VAEIVIGLDVGGTKTEAVVARRCGSLELHVLVRERVPTNAADGYDAILQTICDLCTGVAKEAGADPRIVPIGVGMPGGITRHGGLVKNSNTVCLNGRPFREDLQARLGRRIAVDNDANCSTLAEARLGAAAPHVGGIVFGVILGTGVGGGVAVHGEIWSGAQGIAGEWGHTAVWPEPERVCYCGRRGCVELYASGPSIERACALRIRVENGKSRITFKGPVQPSTMKLRDEFETLVGDGVLLLRIFEELGFQIWFRYEKYREEFSGEGVTVAVDETPVGVFVEIEGSEHGITAMATALGRRARDYVLDSYRGLFLKHRDEFGLSGTDMVFGAPE